MYNSISETVKLSNGVEMPRFGLGVWMAEDPDELVNAIKYAVKIGYRSIDTAAQYGNEEATGRGIRECGIPREEIFLTTKLLNYDQKFKDKAGMIAGFEESLKRLGTDYVDLYLMHWPLNEGKKFLEAWDAIVDIYRSGRARAIGVCNFHIHNIEDIISHSGVAPMVNQCECHPWLNQKELIAYCRGKGIQFECYSPLMHGKLAEMPELADIGKKYGKTPAQVTLRWHLQNGCVIIPKSVHENRILENSGIFDFELTAQEMQYIDSQNRNERFLPDPDLDLTFSPPPEDK